jgi:hypothetical protein
MLPLSADAIKVDARSIAGADGKATREFVKGLDRKQRFDKNKGLKVEAVRVTTERKSSHGIRRHSRERGSGHIIRRFKFDYRGRAASGYKGKTGDCVVRSIAIATGLPNLQVE